MNIGDLVEVTRVSYDTNGDVWRWKEVAFIVSIEQEKFYVCNLYEQFYYVLKSELIKELK